ncbi:uncharacterized protein A1O9_03551 [Exophiala aquamarina CBS 119918]|uniref:Zn(2)-C6 fungal-type domain-containing protein n=1 Tax=Exophiala aquamarina CBS 119918 TaxID=1182545 RepID=A0A072PPE4_9EURO|nr:uncharacterized protein A1O9_03551 [Exophiala aquamarina CBS 119918]KEF61979.1 hypothetical protein A1O9_03551 [Exophiala aquamarina CBS 119918]
MSLAPDSTVSASGSGPEREKDASSAVLGKAPISDTLTAKPRSCIVCRSRKVRCDKQSPCSNCSRANIPCVFPSNNRPPRWTRRLERFTNNTNPPSSDARASMDAKPAFGDLTQKLQSLEALVKELSAQLGQAQAAFSSARAASSRPNSPGRPQKGTDVDHGVDSSQAASADDGHLQFGRLVLRDSNRSHYVSSGFWSRVNDELNELKMSFSELAGGDSDSSDGEEPPALSHPTRELARTPWERNAFLFRHNLDPSTHDLREFHPLPSQVPFIIDNFAENVNFMLQIVHVPTVRKIVRELNNADLTSLTPANEALMFSIYYATVTAMEEDDVMTNFGCSKSDLNLRYRIGLEHALAKADFLNAPEITIVQALTVFLCLAGRHDSPRYVWMMTGLVIRMAQYLGLQRDGSNFESLTPYEIEMRRRVWWAVCNLDLKASEDQGTDLAIKHGSSDTKFPLNINDADLDTGTRQMPTEREGVTDMSFAYITAGLCDVTKQLLASKVSTDGFDLGEQNRLVNEIYKKFEDGYLRYTSEAGNILYWVSATIARLVMAKLRLMMFLPVLFSEPSEQFSDELRTKLMISSIEVIEYNHALNAEEGCRKWRWIFQIYSHWYAIIYLMIEISRRPWSSTSERGWVALHSSWLFPIRTLANKNLRIWVPFRRLMATARKHRLTELSRLRADPEAVARLDLLGKGIPLPTSSGLSQSASTADQFRQRWLRLVANPERPSPETLHGETSNKEPCDLSARTTCTCPPTQDPPFSSQPGYFTPNANFNLLYSGTEGQTAGQSQETPNMGPRAPGPPLQNSNESVWAQTGRPSDNPFVIAPAPSDWSNILPLEAPGPVAWLWDGSDTAQDPFLNVGADDMDINMDLGGDVNWFSWVEATEGLDWSSRPPRPNP